MTRHIGIVAVSAEGAALCYRTICVEGAALLGRHAHPEVTMHTFPLADYMRHIEAGDWGAVGDLLLASVAKLQKTGVELIICPDNTVHPAIDLMRDRSPLPWLHIAEEVAQVAAERGFKRVLVLGTRYLMESEVYPAKLAPRGIACEIPPREVRERINALTMDELVYGEFKESTRSYFKSVIADSQRRGCDAVALSCTEFPLLISDADSPLPTLDSTRILARAALREATRLKLDVFGRMVLVERSANGWQVYYLGGEGKRRRADDIFIPSSVDEAGLERYVADLCHEWATARHPNVVRIP